MSALDAYRAYLGARAGEVQAFPIDGLDRLGVPVWSASAWGEPSAHGVGYGESEHDAERGALGETVESLAAARWAARIRPVELTVREAVARGAVHPARLSPRLGHPVAEDRVVSWVPARRWPDGEERLVPLEAAVTTAGEYGGTSEPLFPPITNGMGAGAGDDLERAVRHGLNELLQRDLNWSSFKALDTGRAVDAAEVWPELVERLERAGVSPRLKYSGHAFGVHAFHCAGLDADPATPPLVRTATGEGADADPRAAARKAMLEYCSSRSRKSFFFGGAPALAVAPPGYRKRFERRAAGGGAGAAELGIDLAERFDALLGEPEALEAVVARVTGVHETLPMPAALPAPPPPEVLVVRMTEPGEEAQVARVIVCGLEAEVLSHGRLGRRGAARLAQRLPEAVASAPVEGWAEVAEPGEERLWVDLPRLEAVARSFFPLYREPDRHVYETP